MQTLPELGPPSLAADLEAACWVLEEVAAHLDEGDAARLEPAVSSWTVGQQLIHTCLVASSIAAAVSRLVERGGEENASLPITRELLASGGFPRGAAQAPRAMIREEPPAEDEIRAALDKARRRWDALRPQSAAIEATQGSSPHFDLGPLSAAEWVRFAAAHGLHHLRIVDEILRAPGGPPPTGTEVRAS